MKRAFWPAALVLAATAGAAGSRAIAQGEGPKAAAKPGPYEYKVFLLSVRDFKDKDDWKEILAADGGNELRADCDFKAYVLNHLASEGWELVQVTNPIKEKNEVVHFYLRRARAR